MRKLKTMLTGLLAALALTVGMSAQAPQVAIANLGQVYYAERYGVVCTDNTATADAVATTNTTKLQALNDLIYARGDKAGVIQLPGGQFCSFNGKFTLGTTLSGGENIAHISLLGRGRQNTTLRWTGRNGQAVGTPAIFVSRNKYFRIGDFGLVNVSSDVVSQYDTGSNLGIRFGGNAGVGTQTFGVWVKQLGIGTFDTCMQWGGNADGSAASDSLIEDLDLQFCNEGMNNTGNFNTLDLHFKNLLGGQNKIMMVTSTGNIDIDGGSTSYNGIDFKSTGFGYFSVVNMRSEGPGRFFWGGEPHVYMRNNTIAEAQGSRPLTGTIFCAPDAARRINLDTFSKTLSGGFYPITFTASALTNADTVKTAMIGPLSNGQYLAGLFRGTTSSTAGNFQMLYSSTGGVPGVDDTNVPLTIYDQNTCAYKASSTTMITQNDVGAAVNSKGGVTTTIGATMMKYFINTVTSTTTGTAFMTPGQGGMIPILAQPGAGSAALAGAGAGNVDNGVHKYYVTFVVNPTLAEAPNGTESEGGTEFSVTVADKTTDGQVSLTSIPLGPASTISRRIYRTAAGVTGITNAHLLTTLADNTTTVYTDNSSDASIASADLGDDMSRSFDTDPVLFDNIVVELTTSGYQTTIENLNGHGIIKVRDASNGGAGSIRINNSKTLNGPVETSQLPIRGTENDNEWLITAAKSTMPSLANASNTIHTTGIQFPGAFTNQTSAQMKSNYSLMATGNSIAVYNSIEHPIADFIGRVQHGAFVPFLYAPRAITGSGSTGDDNKNHYDLGVGIRPENFVGRVASFGEFSAIGNNLKSWCRFDTAQICTVLFQRTEAVSYDGTGGSGTNRDLQIKFSNTANHMDVADLGKPVSISVDNTSLGTRTAYGWIVSLLDSTHFWTERSPGGIPLGSQGSAYGPVDMTIGLNEPDANYTPFITCDRDERFYVVPDDNPSAVSVALAGLGAGNVDNGSHAYYVVFTTALGRSLGSSGASVSVANKAANGQVAVTNIPVGPVDTTARTLYRTTANNSGLTASKFLATIADNTTTTYNDNIADSGLGALYGTDAETRAHKAATGMVIASSNASSVARCGIIIVR